MTLTQMRQSFRSTGSFVVREIWVHPWICDAGRGPALVNISCGFLRRHFLTGCELTAVLGNDCQWLRSTKTSWTAPPVTLARRQRRRIGRTKKPGVCAAELSDRTWCSLYIVEILDARPFFMYDTYRSKLEDVYYCQTARLQSYPQVGRGGGSFPSVPHPTSCAITVVESVRELGWAVSTNQSL